MRAAVGLPALVQGGAYLSGRDDSALWTLAAGLLALATGSLLLLGFLTPFACVLSSLGGAAMAASPSPVYAYNLLHSGPPLLFVLITAAAVMLLGPGAYSLDARLFGRREIIIPRAPNPYKP